MKFIRKNIHKIKRTFQRTGLEIARKINLSSRDRLTNNQLEASILFRKLMSDCNTEMLISPLSGKCYLKSSKRGMLIILSDNQLSVINHIYGYNVYMPVHIYDKLRFIFIEEVERRRMSMEEEFTKNVQHSLKNIIKSLRDEKAV